MNEETRKLLEQESMHRWVPWFRELAAAMADMDPIQFHEVAQQVKWTGKIGQINSLLMRGCMDPFSFLFFLARRNDRRLRLQCYRSVHSLFGLKEAIPDYDMSIPTPPGNASQQFQAVRESDDEARSKQLSDLWSLFRQAVQDESVIDHIVFSEVLSIESVTVKKLTQCLFLINPRVFLPMDFEAGSRFLVDELDVEREIEDRKDGLNNYFRLIERLKSLCPGCENYEIYQFIDRLNRQSAFNIGMRRFQVDTDAKGDGQDRWSEFSDFSCVLVEGDSCSPHQSQPGDAILARFGPEQKLRGIGFVIENQYQYAAERNDKPVMKVCWINKSPASIEGVRFDSKFGLIERESKAFEQILNNGSYRKSLDLIDSHISQSGANSIDRSEYLQLKSGFWLEEIREPQRLLEIYKSVDHHLDGAGWAERAINQVGEGEIRLYGLLSDAREILACIEIDRQSAEIAEFHCDQRRWLRTFENGVAEVRDSDQKRSESSTVRDRYSKKATAAKDVLFEVLNSLEVSADGNEEFARRGVFSSFRSGMPDVDPIELEDGRRLWIWKFRNEMIVGTNAERSSTDAKHWTQFKREEIGGNFQWQSPRLRNSNHWAESKSSEDSRVTIKQLFAIALNNPQVYEKIRSSQFDQN